MLTPDVPGDGNRRRAPARRRARRAGRTRARPGRGGVRAARAGDVALPRRLGALAPQPRRAIDGGEPDLVRVVTLALEARESDRRPLRPDGARRRRRRRLRPHVRRRRRRTRPGRARSPRARAAATCLITGRTIELEPGFRLDLGGIGKGYAADRVAEVLAVAGPCLVNAGGDLAVRGGAWPVGVTDELTLELTRGGLATSGRDRRRWRATARSRAPPDRPRHRPSGRRRHPLRVTVVAGSAAEAEVAAKAAFLGGDGRPPSRPRHRRRAHRPGRRTRVRHDPTFWLLARASGLTAYVMLTLSVLAGLVLKSRPFRSLKPAAVTDLHRILAMLGLGSLAGHAVALVLDTTVKVSIAGALRPGPRLVPARLDVALGVLAGRADGARLRLVLDAQAHRQRRTGAACTGRRTGSSRGHRPRPRRGHRLLAALGLRALRLCGRCRRGRDHLAGSRPPPDARAPSPTDAGAPRRGDGRAAA